MSAKSASLSGASCIILLKFLLAKILGKCTQSWKQIIYNQHTSFVLPFAGNTQRQCMTVDILYHEAVLVKPVLLTGPLTPGFYLLLMCLQRPPLICLHRPAINCTMSFSEIAFVQSFTGLLSIVSFVFLLLRSSRLVACDLYLQCFSFSFFLFFNAMYYALLLLRIL